MERQADILGNDAFAARLGRQPVEERRRHVMMMYVNDKFGWSHD
jgi:hypothetical protein